MDKANEAKRLAEKNDRLYGTELSGNLLIAVYGLAKENEELKQRLQDWQGNASASERRT